MKLAPLAAGMALLLCSSLPSFAQTERDLDAHEHGVAALDVALDGARLYLDLRTPADNVLGFEHAPSTREQREAIEAARAVLESDAPFAPDSAAGCALEDVSVSIELAGEGDEHADDGHHGDEEHSDKEHSDEEHSDDDHHGDREHSDDEHADAGTHSEIETSHVFACEQPERLESVATTLFDAFPGFEEIAVQLVGPGGQTALELSAGQSVIDLAPVR